MSKRKTDSIYTLPMFSQFKEVKHGFSTRKFGTMNPKDATAKKNKERFVSAVDGDFGELIAMEQVHSNTIARVNWENSGETIKETDGLYTKSKNVYLSTLSADCVPVLLFDSERKIIGAIHAGWKGVYNEIVPKLIKQLLQESSKKDDIFIGLGPSIRACCYAIDMKRAALFRKKYPKWQEDVLHIIGNETFCSLQTLLIHQIVRLGIPREHIEDIHLCTKDRKDTFYSYRGDKKNFPLKECVSVIAIV